MRAGLWAFGIAALAWGGCQRTVDQDAIEGSFSNRLSELIDLVWNHPVQTRLLNDLQCNTEYVCAPDADMPVAVACDALEGPWREEAHDALLACAEACLAIGCGACLEMDCAAVAATQAELGAEDETGAACEAKQDACDLDGLSCAMFAVLEGDVLEALETCLDEDCDSVVPCIRDALVFDESLDP